ncbi:hypothetical protein LLG34_06405 [bacterium]|nr:hypothetical protein [bacterium]
MKYKHIIYIIPLLLFVACVQTPHPTEQESSNYSKPAAFILCEGLYGYNNASLTRYDMATNKTNTNFIEENNPGNQLGDIANDAILKGDSLFVLVSTSKVLYLIDAQTGKIIKYYAFEGFRYPRRMVIANDSLLYFSDAYDNSINEFNINLWEVTNKISVGPQPEGLFYFQNKIYVVNSGWGDINKNNPGAGTLWIINTITKNIENKIIVGPNPVEIILDSLNNRYFITYYNYPSAQDSLGGTIEFDLQSNKELMHWRGNFNNITLDYSGKSLFAIYNNSPKLKNNGDGGVAIINLVDNSMKLIIKNPLPNNIWYSLSFDKLRNYIWVGNAKNFQVNGEVLIFDLSNPDNAIKSFQTGVNPNRILFYN